VAVDFPSWKLFFEMHRQAMRQRALAEVLFEKKGLARIEFGKRAYHLVQLGLHPRVHRASDRSLLEPDRKCIGCPGQAKSPGHDGLRRIMPPEGSTVIPTSALRSAAGPFREWLPPAP